MNEPGAFNISSIDNHSITEIEPTTSEDLLCSSNILRSAILKHRGMDIADTVRKVYEALKEIDNMAKATVVCTPSDRLVFKIQSNRFCTAGSSELTCFISLV
ncbi:unnamed protein product [Anisakis simplex]|uniref:Ground-like domain-containing protein n=1 Tax=Anisakis simplex TaxID=6269 RepID=A0A0M3JU02_ANISI|nr:unnamed protein product [Anisakis simplex]